MRDLLFLGLRRAPLLVAITVIVVGVLLVPAFGRLGYWFELSHQNFTMAALALVLTPIIITGGIDLSVGSVVVFTSVLIGTLWRDLGWPIGWALAGGAAAGMVAGFGNGMLVRLGLLPLVATLATRELFRGLALSISSDPPVSNFPPQLGELWRTPLVGLPAPLLLLGVLFLVNYVLVHHTWVGRMLFALGDNERAARYAGVPVGRIKLGIYAWAGLVAGVCGAASVLEYDSAKADADKAQELAAIACVILGGVRITGGAGNVAGTLIGIVTLSVLLGGLLNVRADWRETLTGALLIVVALSTELLARYLPRSRGETTG